MVEVNLEEKSLENQGTKRLQPNTYINVHVLYDPILETFTKSLDSNMSNLNLKNKKNNKTKS